MAVSTFCKICGEHYKLEPAPNKAPFGLGVLFGGKKEASPFHPAVNRPTSHPEKPGAGNGNGENGETGNSAKEAPAADDEDFNRTSDGVEWFDADELVPPPPPPRTPIPAPPPPSKPDDELDDEEFVEVEAYTTVESSGIPFAPKKPDPSDRKILCVGCRHELFVSKHATSTICPNCSEYVSLESFTIANHRRENIRTRGNVSIQRKASLTASEVVCDNLKVYGKISGKIDCAGTAFFHCSGKVVGSLRCKHLIIHKICNLTFLPGIHADTAEIHGEVKGDIICDGKIKISKTATVIGDCTAPTVVLEDGGNLCGQMRFMKPDQELMADYDRRAREAHDEFFDEEADQAETEAVGGNVPATGDLEDEPFVEA